MASACRSREHEHRVADDREEPRPGVPALITVEDVAGAKGCVLDGVTGVVRVAGQPASKVVPGVQVRCDDPLEMQRSVGAMARGIRAASTGISLGVSIVTAVRV